MWAQPHYCPDPHHEIGNGGGDLIYDPEHGTKTRYPKVGVSCTGGVG